MEEKEPKLVRYHVITQEVVVELPTNTAQEISDRRERESATDGDVSKYKKKLFYSMVKITIDYNVVYLLFGGPKIFIF